MRTISLLVMLVLAVGCASTDPGPAAERVQADVAARSGWGVTWQRDADPAALGAAASSPEALGERVGETAPDATAQPLPVLELEQAVALALQHNQALQARFEELGVAQGELAQATVAAAPLFSGNRMYLHGASPGWALALAVDLAQYLLLPLQRDLGEAQLTKAELVATAAILDCVQAVREEWYALVAANQSLGIALDELLAAEAAHELAQRLREAGNISELELLRRRAPFETAKLAIARAETALEDARERLNARLGLWGGAALWAIPAALPAAPEQELVLDELEARAVAASLELALARQEVQLRAQELGLAEWRSWLPSLEVGAETKREAGADKWQAGPVWSLPVSLLAPPYGTKAAGHAAIRRDWHRYQAEAVAVRAAARAVRAQLLHARQALEYQQRVVLPLQQNITTQTQLHYNAMQLGVFDLLTAKREELEQRRALVRAGLDYWLARSRAEHLLAGRLAGTSGGPGLLLDDALP